MEKRGSVSNNMLLFKLSFGKAKANQHFENEDAMKEYVDGDGLTFSQRKEEPQSPFQHKINDK